VTDVVCPVKIVSHHPCADDDIAQPYVSLTRHSATAPYNQAGKNVVESALKLCDKMHRHTGSALRLFKGHKDDVVLPYSTKDVWADQAHCLGEAFMHLVQHELTCQKVYLRDTNPDDRVQFC
jgi:hypothetical protein